MGYLLPLIQARLVESRWMHPFQIGHAIDSQFTQRSTVTPQAMQIFGIDEYGSWIQIIEHIGQSLAVCHKVHLSFAKNSQHFRVSNCIIFNRISNVFGLLHASRFSFFSDQPYYQMVHVSIDEAGKVNSLAEVLYLRSFRLSLIDFLIF